MQIKCISPGCSREVARDELKTPKSMRMGLCRGCRSMVTFRCVPTAGFIPTTTTNILGRKLLEHASPVRFEKLEAERTMRGPRHRVGKWNDRPTPSLHMLFNSAPLSRRLPTILVGRRSAPTIASICAALCQFHLAHRVIGVNAIGNRYPYILCGMQYFQRRGLSKPTGSINTIYRDGETKVVKQTYHLNHNDYGTIGKLLVTKAAPKIGLSPKDKAIGTLIESWYFEGVAAGTLRPHIVVPHGSHTTKASGDSPLDLYLPSGLPMAPQYQGKIRRGGGTVNRIYPDGLDDLFRSADGAGRMLEYVSPELPTKSLPVPPPTTPDLSWIFAGK